MHFSAKRGIAYCDCMMSVCLSVTLVHQDQIGLKSCKLIARTLNLTLSLFVAQRPFTYTPRGTWGNFGRLEVGWEKVVCCSTKVAISLKRVQIEKKLLRRAYMNSPTLFPMAPSLTPYGLLFPKIGGWLSPPKTPIAIISGTGKDTDFKFGQNNNRVHPNKSPWKV